MLDIWNDITDHFELLEDKLVYVDAPLEGILRAKSGDLFAFRCAPIVRGCVWHWVLLPVETAEDAVSDAFESAQRSPPVRWLSIVEDRRGGPPRLAAAWLLATEHGIPVTAFK